MLKLANFGALRSEILAVAVRICALGKSTRNSTVALGAIVVIGMRIYGAFIALLINVLLARILSPTDLGIYVFAWTWVSLLSMLAPLGSNTVVIRFIPTYTAQKNWGLLAGVIRYTLVVSMIAAVSFVGIGYIANTIFASVSSAVYYDATAIAIFIIPLFTIINVFEEIARGFKWIAWTHLAGFVIRPTLFLVCCGAVFLFHDRPKAEAIVFAAMASCVISISIQIYIFIRKVPNVVKNVPPRQNLRLWTRTAIPLLLVSCFEVVLQNTDLVMLGLVAGPADTGIYNAGLRISGCLLFIYFAVQAFSAPKIAGLFAEEKYSEMLDFVRQARFWIFMPTLALAAIVILNGKLLLSLFGPDFVAAYPAMIFLTCGILIRALFGPIDSLLSMTGHQNQVAICMTIAAMLNVLANWYFIPRFGISGAALATAMSTSAEIIALSIIAWKTHKLTPFLLIPVSNSQHGTIENGQSGEFRQHLKPVS